MCRQLSSHAFRLTASESDDSAAGGVMPLRQSQLRLLRGEREVPGKNRRRALRATLIVRG